MAEPRDRMLSEAIGKLSAAAAAALDRLRWLRDDEAATVRLRAATAIPDAMVKVHEHVALAGRAAEVEQRLEAEGHR